MHTCISVLQLQVHRVFPLVPGISLWLTSSVKESICDILCVIMKSNLFKSTLHAVQLIDASVKYKFLSYFAHAHIHFTVYFFSIQCVGVNSWWVRDPPLRNRLVENKHQHTITWVILLWFIHFTYGLQYFKTRHWTPVVGAVGFYSRCDSYSQTRGLVEFCFNLIALGGGKLRDLRVR